jgi:hypothetical protein
MVNVFVALLSVLLPLVHLSLSRRAKTRRRVIYLLLLYALVFDVGIVGLIFGFIPHVFLPIRQRRASAGRTRSNLRSDFTMGLGASWASCASGSVARFGLQPDLDGPSS